MHVLGLDPANWRKQDHYLLLGLHEKRHQATPAEIKAAYRRRVLQYHPDKLQQQASGGQRVQEGSVEDNIFKCIFHAYQVLSDPDRRKQYDSVDAHSFDESLPAEDAVVPPENVEAFLSIYRPVFIRNARFSKKQPVPDLGHACSPREEVEAFYAFWANFESWRMFDYLDEDESEHAENRADKRWLERKNRASRLKRKNEDNARLRRLFEQAYRLDPRMSRFREDDRLRKEAIKMEKEMAALRITQEQERQRREREEQVRKQAEEAAAEQARLRREREALQAQRLRDKRAFKSLFLDNLYFVKDMKNVALITERSMLVERYIVRAGEDLQAPLKVLQELLEKGASEELIDWLRGDFEARASPPGPPSEAVAATGKANGTGPAVLAEEPAAAAAAWSLPELETLINAIKTHPGGLRDRWACITEWYNRHISHLNKELPRRTQEELIRRSNEIRQTANTGKADVIVPAEATTDYRAQQKKRDPRIDQAEPTLVHTPAGWAPEEQKRLEQGLKIHKSDDPARWDKIADFVGRPKKDCMLRAKEIAQLLKKKKATES